MMIERITLDMLTKDSVSVKKQKYIVQDGVEYTVGQSWRRAYVNNINGRQQVENEIEEPYKTIIFMMWGDKPTIED